MTFQAHEVQTNYPDAWKCLTETPPIDIDNIENPQIRHLLEDIQGNILKSHGRAFSIFIFLQFGPENPNEIKTWIANLADKVVSALKQQDQKRKFQSGSSSELFMNFSLSFEGYTALGLPAKRFYCLFPYDNSFESGMRETASDNDLTPLGDDLKKWEQGYENKNIHAMILLAHSSHEQLREQTEAIVEEIKSNHIKIVKMEVGCVRKNNKGQSIEPFGFPDGISQPLFFTEDINRVKRNRNWDPTAKLGLVLNVDPFGEKFVDRTNHKHYSFGSFLVYQKLEQDVESFNQKVTDIAHRLNYEGDIRSPEERENLVRAFVVGRRREDGCPVYSHDPNENYLIDSNDSRELNDFNYGAGREFENCSASKCPFNAHIRRMNPRGIEVQGKPQSGYVFSGPYENSPSGQRSIRIVRRGVPYGLPKDTEDTSYLAELTKNNLKDYKNLIKNLNELGKELEVTIEESKEGLLFCCFQHNIDNQFYLLQVDYANDPDRGPNKNGLFGVDSLIGREPTHEKDKKPRQGYWSKKWGDESAGDLEFKTLEESKFSNYVIPRGGKYFFTPSISFLKSLKEE